MRTLLSLLLSASIVVPAVAQTPDPSAAGVPADVARWIELVLEDTATVRLEGGSRIGATDRIEANVVASNGALTVAGRVGGHVVVLDGSIVFEPGAVVTGDVVVVSGRMIGFEQARIGGTVTVYDEGFTFEAEPRRWPGREPPLDRTDSDLAVGIAGNYNRVEGLPIHIGPQIRTAGPNWLRLEAAAILRTEPGAFDTHEMGYRALVEQRLPHLGGLRIGATAASVIEPMDAWAFSDTEASLAAALFHDDLRDYYERTGWSAYLRFVPAGMPLDTRIEYRSEDHASAPLRDPWTLFNGDHDWRLLPLAAEGRLELVGGSARLDLRRGSDFAVRGWFFDAGAWQRIDGTITVPAWTPIAAEEPPIGSGLAFGEALTFGLVDARRYQTIGRDGVLAIRVLAAGSVDAAALPPQYQHALGGAGSLPGYGSLSVDCGARSFAVTTGVDQRRAFARYGCDRVALAQLEYRGAFDVRFGGESGARRRDRDWKHFDTDPEWIVFFDAGRGWSYATVAGSDDFSTRTLYDAGAGITLGDLGVFAAVPLTGDDRSLRFFVRMGPRF